ncbi:hypothetical protein Arub01_36320 [Actinomadura rubrobrunea]|uniref:DUF2637 domain-containing protein n=1 Tax=Actinomadura rubrobrunea TaxID=115335 RepID=A0A9W6UWT5_9ACTN|nr:DUF2637 domain-containing protein [Actinomadura rubrobrunea]GLW65388.1 hypothetical protein Arub01_36320 [Actinomadura rubrobrunea]
MPTDHPGPPDAPRGAAPRRLLAATAGLAVAALAACAFVLTYDVLRDLAVAGRVPRRWAWAYPVMTDVLVVVVILSLVVARHARWWSRLVRWALLAALLAGMAAVGVQRAVWGLASLPDDQLRAGVAVAPHVMLIVGVWLWLTMVRRLRTAEHRPKVAGTGAPAPEPEPAPEPAPAVVPAPALPEPAAPADDEPPATEPLESVPAEPALVPRDEPATAPVEDEPVRGRDESGTKTTRPDIPLPVDEDTELVPVDRAEDPDAGDEPLIPAHTPAPAGDAGPDDDADRADDMPIWDWNPPSGSLRSSPTPPGDSERND